MSRLANSKLERQKKEREAKKNDPNTDNRNIASKVFDTLNPLDSGRSFTTKAPSEEQKNKSAGRQAKDIVGNLFDNTIKTANTAIEGGADTVELARALTGRATGNKAAEQAAIDRGLSNTASDEGTGILGKGGVLQNEELSKPIPTDRFVKKTVGTGLGVAGEVLPGSKGAKAAQGASRMAKAKIAAKAAGEGAAIGGAGAAGSTIANDNVDLTSQEGIKTAAEQTLLGAATGGVLGGASAAIVPNVRPLDERGSIMLPGKIKSSISPDLKSEIDRGAIDGRVETASALDLQLGSDTLGVDLTPSTVESYKAQIARGEPIDPIVVRRGSDGSDYIADGAHRFEAAKQLGITEIPIVRQKNNVVMAAKVEPPTVASLEVPLNMKVMKDFQDEVASRTPTDKPVAQKAETQVQQGAQYIVDDIDELQKATGIDVAPLDRQVAASLTGEVRRSTFQEFKDKMGRNFQDTLTYASRTIGREGADFVYDMLKGNKFKRDALDALRTPLQELEKLNKKVVGKSLTARRDAGARIGQALDDRANADQYLKTPQERELFDNYVKVFDYVKTLREKAGLEVLENYRPWVNMKEASEPPIWLADNITTKRTQTVSRFSKERTRTAPDESVDNNLADMIYGYVNSQLNELAYDAPVKKFKTNFDNITSGNKAQAAHMNDGIDYLRTLVEQAVNPQRKSPVERFAGKLTSNVYGSILPFNVRLAVQNKSQKFVANSRVSGAARSLAKKMDEADLKDLEGGLVFGDSTVYGQLEDINPLPKGTRGKLVEKAKKVDPYQRSEKNNVLTSYYKGVAQAIVESDQYKAALANGASKKEAAKIALQTPDIKEAAIRRGNVVVNDTQFGASPLARPEMLREEGSIWGVLPKKSVYMFTRFPIGMSQHVLETLNSKNARALEILKNGDPRTVPIAEMRTNYSVLLESMKDAKTAIKEGADINIPENVLDDQIKVVADNLKIIDKEAKKASQIRTGKAVKNLGKMWAAAALIQIIFDGGLQSFAEDPVAVGGEAISKTNPTVGNRIVGSYSPLASISTSASPLDRRGDLNERALLNYIPVVGLAVNRGRDIQKIYESLAGSSEQQ